LKTAFTFVVAGQCDQLLKIPQVRKEARVIGCSGATLGLPLFLPKKGKPTWSAIFPQIQLLNFNKNRIIKSVFFKGDFDSRP
jgi:hypothetical protein